MSVATLSRQAICPNASEVFQAYFEALGYKVYWEGRLETGERWYEFCDDGRLVFQISMPVPSIAELREDLPKLLAGAPTDGPTVYRISCPDLRDLRVLLARMDLHSTQERA